MCALCHSESLESPTSPSRDTSSSVGDLGPSSFSNLEIGSCVKRFTFKPKPSVPYPSPSRRPLRSLNLCVLPKPTCCVGNDTQAVPSAKSCHANKAHTPNVNPWDPSLLTPKLCVALAEPPTWGQYGAVGLLHPSQVQQAVQQHGRVASGYFGGEGGGGDKTSSYAHA